MEILYALSQSTGGAGADPRVRWLGVDDYALFCEQLTLCGQRVLEKAKWDEIYSEETIYCGLFVDDIMVSRACVEKYSVNAWEVADVRTAKPYRGNGYAFQVCSFVLKYILDHGKTATMRTEEDNEKMKKVIAKLGFSVL